MAAHRVITAGTAKAPRWKRAGLFIRSAGHAGCLTCPQRQALIDHIYTFHELRDAAHPR